MNERLKMLAKKATIHFEDDKQNRIHYISTTTLETFAKLIVQECALLADSKLATTIKEHFEIKDTV